jgi:DNA polymerase-3 subunit epsilon/ATP-dependent DNA helicase DinG
MNKTYVSLDLETTGLDPRNDEIIEIGAVKFRRGKVLETFHALAKPIQPLPYRIQILTGITVQEVDSAPPLAVALSDLVSFLDDHPIVGQSVSFDLGFLTENGVSLSNPTYDTFELATILLPAIPDYSLSAIAEQLGVLYSIKHRALPDAMMAKDVFLALLDKAYELDISIVAEIDRLARGVDWSPARLFHQIVEEKLGDVFSQAGEPVLHMPDKEREERLSPASHRKAIDIGKLADMLSPDGLMARAFPSFEHRPEQMDMMRAVACALNQGQHLVVEAGTGTGKSIAYLLPATFFALGNGVPLVISTNTINLQEQLVSKDIPDLIRALEQESLPAPRYAQLKGRNNYLCLRRWTSLRRSQPLPLEEVKLLIRTLVWTAATMSGDRAELNLRGEELHIWNRMCAQSENCLGAQCPYQRQGDCFLYRARRKAESAHLIVVNHALLLSDIASSGRSRILPDYSHLIVDEAHHIEEVATEQWGFDVEGRYLESYLNSLNEMVAEGRYTGFLFELGGHFRGSSVSPAVQGDIERLVDDMKAVVEACRERILTFFNVLWHFLEGHTEEQGGYERRLRITKAVRSQPGWDDVEFAWENLGLVLEDIESRLNRLYNMLEPLSDAKVLEYEGLMMELSSLVYHVGELRQQVNSAVSQPENGQVYWASLRERGNSLTLHAAPLHVGRVMEDSLFSKKECVVLTSATLSTEDNFEYIKERLGLMEASELLLGSSFDFMGSAMIYIPEDIPEPGQMGYQKAVEQVLIDICRVTGGRVLALFTSYSSLRASYQAIRTPLQGEGILVLGQGIDGSTKNLLETFKTNLRTVLLGTSSFWEGIDVVGEALSVLIMARLPFSVPTDPVFAARAELFEEPFKEYAIPQAVLRFKQGFGRLIRSKSDRGVIVVLDRRIKAKSYGAAFLGSLPPCTVKSGPARHLPREVAAWLQIG